MAASENRRESMPMPSASSPPAVVMAAASAPAVMVTTSTASHMMTAMAVTAPGENDIVVAANDQCVRGGKRHSRCGQSEYTERACAEADEQ